MGQGNYTEICTRVSALMDQVDENSDLTSFTESLDDVDRILAGAAVARAYLSGAVTISEKTIPLISEAETALTEFVDGLDLEEDEEDVEEGDDDE